jgi:hypothetical protein
MFYNVHAYLAEKFFNSKDSLLIIGSFLPDIAITKIFEWDKGLHGKENANQFIKFLQKEEPQFDFLGKGVLAHCIVDDYSHLEYAGGTGFAYQNNKKLAALIKRYYKVDDTLALKKAHNFIEIGVDISLLNDYPQIYSEVNEALENTNKLKISQVLGKYFNMDSQKIHTATKIYFELITKNDLTIKESWILLWKDLSKMMKLNDIKDEEIQLLIDEGVNIVKNTYKDYLNFCVTDGSKFIK